VKSVVGADEVNTPQGNKKELKGILFDRYHKIPKPKPSKLSPNMMPEYMKALSKGSNLEDFVKEIWNSKASNAKNPLASTAWRLAKTISSQ
ncbi:hypothetical protein H4S08_002672, partial [Coemansia sp. RSA 1365]